LREIKLPLQQLHSKKVGGLIFDVDLFLEITVHPKAF